MPITIDKGSKYFNTVLYTGTGSTQSISGLSFSPDLVWIKQRSAIRSHVLYDVIRGATKDLRSNDTTAEATDSATLSSFNSDGFTVVTDDKVNVSSGTYVAWAFDANGAGVSNTSGTISSTVSANTTSGFSIVSYTGNATAGATVGHGLGVTPKMVIIKDRDNGTTAWFVYHSAIGTAGTGRLNSTNAFSDTAFMTTAPSSTVITLTGTTIVNGSSEKMIAYCFAEVKGYSKAFSYTGNGSSDGTFVYLGFRPSWLLIKRTDSAGYDWLVYDNKRQVEYNVVDDFLKPNTSDAETTGNANQSLDFLSNGVKFRGSGASSNASGGTYIGFAIAENPFVSSKGVAVTAR